MRKKRRSDLRTNAVDSVFNCAVIIEPRNQLATHTTWINALIIGEINIDVQGKSMP
jgi:hypothetical protein